jgi:hypothetical protein
MNACQCHRAAPVFRPVRLRSGAARRAIPVPAGRQAFQRCAFLLRLKARGAPSVARPLGGTAIHRIAVYFRLARVLAPLPGRYPARRRGFTSRLAMTLASALKVWVV